MLICQALYFEVQINILLFYNMKSSFVISNKFTDENLPLQIVI